MRLFCGALAFVVAHFSLYLHQFSIVLNVHIKPEFCDPCVAKRAGFSYPERGLGFIFLVHELPLLLHHAHHSAHVAAHSPQLEEQADVKHSRQKRNKCNKFVHIHCLLGLLGWLVLIYVK